MILSADSESILLATQLQMLIEQGPVLCYPTIILGSTAVRLHLWPLTSDGSLGLGSGAVTFIAVHLCVGYIFGHCKPPKP